MKRDLKRHRLLKLLSDKTVQFDIGDLPRNEPMGVLFVDLMSQMKCNRVELELILSELYKNDEISVADIKDTDDGISCDKNGTVSFANHKYKSRYWRDFWTNLFTISQIIVPILALVIALVTVLDSQQSREHTEEILLLRKELNMQREILNSQTNKIQSLYETILLNDSLTHKNGK